MIVRFGLLIAACVALVACSEPEMAEPIMEDTMESSGKL